MSDSAIFLRENQFLAGRPWFLPWQTVFLFHIMLVPIHPDILTPKIDIPDFPVPPEFRVKTPQNQFFAGRSRFLPRQTVFLFHKKLVPIKTHLQNPKHGGANQVYPPKIGPKGPIFAIFSVFGRQTTVFALADRFFIS